MHLILFFDFSLLPPINSDYFFVLFLGNPAKLPVFAFPTDKFVPSAAFCLTNEIPPYHLPVLFMLEFFLGLLINSTCWRAG